MIRRFLPLCSLRLWMCAVLLPINIAHAGSTNTHTLSSGTLLEHVSFSKAVEKYLARQYVEVAIIARLGRPRSQLPEGVNFTHVGIAVYSMASTNDGRRFPGYVFYNLYQSSNDAARSELVIDSAADFFASITQSKAGIVIPHIQLQRSLKRLLMSNHYAGLHRPEYSVIANPMSLQFQNCTEFVLDLITAAIYQTHDRSKIKANERAYFSATPIRMSRAKVVLGSLFNRGISISDHGDQIETATFSSIADYLQRHRALQTKAKVCDNVARGANDCDIYL